MRIIGWASSNRTGTSFGDGKVRGLPVPNLPPCHWSSQLFDLRAPSSTDVPVLLLNQPNVSMSDFQPEPYLSTSWENSQHFETPPMVNPRNDVWEPAQKFRTNDLGSASDWMKQILNQSEALRSIRSLRSKIRSFQARLVHLIVKTFLES